MPLDILSITSAPETRAAANPETLVDAPFLRAVADLADDRGDARFTPGAGVLFDRPLTRDERRALPEPGDIAPRYLDLPVDRHRRALAQHPEFAGLVAKYTIPHYRAGYRMVIIPLTRPLSAGDLRLIADAGETFGHGTIRLTADVSIRLPNVPEALLRPLFAALTRGGLYDAVPQKMAA